MELRSFRERARNALKGNWGSAIIAALVASVCGADSGGVSFSFEFNESDFEGFEGTELGNLSEQLDMLFEQHGGAILAFFSGFVLFALVMGAVMFCLGSIVSVGYQKFNLDLVDGKRVSIGTLFTYFKHWKNAILANLLSTLYIFLWSLLCGIPGIIASYKYSMVPYILAENPDLRPQEALDRSAALMNGNKLSLFCLHLSFIGWHLLCILSCGLGYIWLTPYINASVADFYREISGTRYASSEPELAEPFETA